MADATDAQKMPQAEVNAIFFRTAGRHIVTLSYIYCRPGETEFTVSGIISGFIIEIEGIWFFITAGHVINEIRDGLTLGGQFDRWRLDDQTAGNEFHGAAIPVDFEIDDWMVFHDENLGFDYAALPIVDEMYRKNLEAGGVRPITRRMWASHTDPDWKQWILIGVPAETVARKDSLLTAKMLMVPVTPADRPVDASGTVENRFFGKLQFDPQNPVSSQNIKGMSGGPVFATRKVGDGQMGYAIIGVQSSWYPTSQIISVCPFAPMAEGLETALRKFMESRQDSQQTDEPGDRSEPA